MDRGGPPTAVHPNTVARDVRRDHQDNRDQPDNPACHRRIRPWISWIPRPKQRHLRLHLQL
jgi:hypothetical protein